MNFPRSAVALTLIAWSIGCSKPAAPASASSPPPAASAASGNGAVAGRIAPALAPPAALVTLEPDAPMELPVRSEPAVMDQAGYEFIPGFLVVQAGQTVQFRNSEDVLHNVRVAEASTYKPVFNVATVASGKYDHVFEPGYYNVSCDIHPTMRASILATATPYTATTGPDGGFSIADVLPGRYKLTVYAGAAPVVRPVDIAAGGADLGLIQ